MKWFGKSPASQAAKNQTAESQTAQSDDAQVPAPPAPPAASPAQEPLVPPPEGWASRNEVISYNTGAITRIAAMELAGIEAGQDLRARMLRLEKRGAERPLRVLFLVPHIALFDAYASVYAAMDKDPAFAPEILAFQRRDIQHDVSEAETQAFFQDRGIAAHVVGFGASNDVPEIDPEAYDVLFYTLGALAYPEPYRIARTSQHFLTCYLAYGVLLAEQPDLQYNQDSQHCAWRVYASTRRDVSFYAHYRKRIRPNARLTGYPKFDLVPARGQGRLEGRPLVVWAPHWTIGLVYPLLNMGMFDQLCMGMLTLMDECPKIDFVYRPHPNLRHALAATTFMSGENYDIYLAMLAARPNCRIDPSHGNLELFAESDAMITDSVSFLAEYLPTGKPLMFLDRPDRARLNDQGEQIAALHRPGRNLEDIRAFLADIVAGAPDPDAANRQAVAKTLFGVGDGSAAAAILADLHTTLMPAGPVPRRDIAATLEELQQRKSEQKARAQEFSNAYWTRQSAYDYALNFPDRYRNQIEFIERHFLPVIAGNARVLDIGCADGWSSCAVARSCGELNGFDFNPAFIELARRNAAAAGLTNCRFEVADALAIVIPAESYDAAMLGGLLTCIVDDAKAAEILAKVARSLKPGEHLVLKDTLNRGDGDRLNIQDGYGAIYRSLASYRLLTERAGFSIEAGEWIDAQPGAEQGSYMLLARKASGS